MAEPFKIEIDDRQVIDALNRLAAAGRDLTPAMRAIATALLSQTEANFAAESGPLGKWPELKPATRNARARKGKWPGKMLQMSAAGLASSVHAYATANEAGVGVGVIYAAIHQLGGPAGRGLKSLIPPRPYLPALPDGQLQNGLEDEVIEVIQSYLLRAVG